MYPGRWTREERGPRAPASVWRVCQPGSARWLPPLAYSHALHAARPLTCSGMHLNVRIHLNIHGGCTGGGEARTRQLEGSLVLLAWQQGKIQGRAYDRNRTGE